MRWWWLLWGACSPDPVTEPPPDAPDALPPGPGLGNPDWSEDELFQPVAWFDNDNGVPAPSLEVPSTLSKPFGTNTAYMHDGWMFTLFAGDSGFGPGGLLVYDVSDPRAPALVTSVFEPEPETGRTWDLRESHTMAFSWRDGRKLVALHTGLGVQLWDLTDAHAPERVGSLDLPGVQFGDYDAVAWFHAWQGRYLYVASSGAGLFVVDTSDPTAPVLADIEGGANPIPPSELGGFRVGPVYAVGTTLVVSSMDNETGYALLDAADPLRPALLSARDGLPKFYATCFSGGYVYTSVRGGGASTLIDDVNDPFVPRWTSTDVVIDEQLYCGTQDQFVFQGCEGSVVKLDVSDPSSPTIVGRGTLPRHNVDHGQVTAFGHLLFVGNDHGTGSAFMPHAVGPDLTPPAVSFVSPADGSVAVGAGARVGVTFTDNVDVGSVNAGTFTLRDPAGREVQALRTVQGHIVNLDPLQPLLPETTYTLSVPADGVRDWVGNPVADAFTSTFTTAPDPGPLALTATLSGPASAVVGEPVTFRLDVAQGRPVDVRWRPDDAWIPATPGVDLVHRYDAPGHYTAIATLTDGGRRVTLRHRVTVHRPLPPAPPVASHTLALDAARGLVWTANLDNDSVSALADDTLDLVLEVGVDAHPRGVAVDARGRVWVTSEAAGTVSVLDGDDGALLHTLRLHPGSAPAGILVVPATDRVVVALEGSGEVVMFDAATYAPVAAARVAPGPFGLAATGDGQRVYVTHHRSPADGARVSELDGALGIVRELRAWTDETTLDGEDRARGVPNLLRAAGLTPDEAELWLPSTQANVLRGGHRDGQPLTHETTLRAVVPRLLLDAGEERQGRRLDLNDRAPPVDVAFSPLGDYAFLALQGSARVAVHEAYSGQPLGSRAAGQHGVQGLVVSPDGRWLYAHHLLSRSVTRHDLASVYAGTFYDPPIVATGRTVTSERMPPEVLRGKILFYSAWDRRLAKDGYIACAGCHPDGGHDGQTWDFTDRGEGLRNTIDLRGRAGLGHGPLHWTANFDEVQDFENDLRGAFGGTGLLADPDFQATADPLGPPKAGLSDDLDALAAYVTSLRDVPTSPWGPAEGGLSASAERGAGLFADLGCDACHALPEGTVSAAGERYDVGTLTDASGQRRGGPLDGLDVPTVRGLHATAPYLHDGSAADLHEVFLAFNPGDDHGVTSPLAPAALDDLVAYLREL